MLTLIFNLEWYRRSFWIDFDYILNLDFYFYNEGTYVNSQKSNNGGLPEKKNKEGLPNSTKNKHWVMNQKQISLLLSTKPIERQGIYKR